MKKMLTNLYFGMMKPLRNERGAQSLEWLGIAALVILVLGIISTAVSGANIGQIVSDIVDKIRQMVG
ncbi:MAG TPA: hypothetical protein VK048_05800 [Atopostipes sp.]|nr:hypothetical protein [Atopostipes sp.]